jgi:hypothetical protein
MEYSMKKKIFYISTAAKVFHESTGLHKLYRYDYIFDISDGPSITLKQAPALKDKKISKAE